MRIKICGITQEKDALQAVQLGAWALGFIFYRQSPRWIEPIAARTILESLDRLGLRPQHCVGVFVNASLEEIQATVAMSGIDTVQLHGDESPEDCAALKELNVWKAFRLHSADQIKTMLDYEAYVQAFLCDAAVSGQYGGTGQVVDWDLVVSIKSRRQIILSGGLHADNIKDAAIKVNAFAYDLSSGVEQMPGKKDPQKLIRLFAHGSSL
ncbi:MAG: phosphoribosylanthranilate isomerase [Proteobacteria bacterium]|nr:phosphoribosylanthranilate isomerase [Pseudomonadota bacterium]